MVQKCNRITTVHGETFLPRSGKLVQELSKVIDNVSYRYKKELSNLLNFVANIGPK
jgi:hypothetical protein